MSIVERAADKLRQADPGGAPHGHTVTAFEGPRHAEVAAGGQEEAGRTQDRPAPARVSIDFTQLRRMGLVPPVAAEDTVAREYQRIKRPLLANASRPEAPGIADANRFMVASAIAGEGKTFTAVNLALSFARERDYSVVLVDGDVIKPSISRVLGMTDRQGLTDILADESISLRGTIIETDVPRLSVLPAGQRYKNATELLSSQRMAWFISELSRDPNRMVVFDSPPLLATSEAQALALSVGQILVVVKAGSTGQEAVIAALSLISTADKSISLILNQSTKAQGDYYAAYYGGYYDDQHAGT